MFVFILCPVAKTNGNARGGSITLAIETVA